MILIDTGPLVAIANAADNEHARCVAFFATQRPPLIVPDTVIPEVCYLIERGLGPAAEASFLRTAFTDLTIEHVTPRDLARCAELVNQYAGLGLGTVDASVIAIAERLGLRTIATLDRRHFSVVRPRHIAAFQLVP